MENKEVKFYKLVSKKVAKMTKHQSKLLDLILLFYEDDHNDYNEVVKKQVIKFECYSYEVTTNIRKTKKIVNEYELTIIYYLNIGTQVVTYGYDKNAKVFILKSDELY